MATNVSVIIVRQQAWFRPFVDVQELELFPIEKIDFVRLQPTSVFRPRVLLGRGPVERDLTPEFLTWFEHGDQEYPIFQSPGISPSDAALKLSSKPRRLVASAEEALGLIEISLVQPVDESFREEYERERNPSVRQGPSAMVQQWLVEAKVCLEQVIGLYVLYQYPVVWEPIGVHPVVGFFDPATQTFRLSTVIKLDNFIPFRLNAVSKVRNGELFDHCLDDFSRLGNRALHFPLFLLQRALWQQNVQLRFLETFLLLDYLAGQSGIEDPSRKQREQLYETIENIVRSSHPEHEERVRALKHIVLQAPLRERLGLYLGRLGVVQEDQALRRMLRIRNDLAHARPVDENVLTEVELEARALVREVMRRELAVLGISFGGSAA